jgi:hypothetical protein
MSEFPGSRRGCFFVAKIALSAIFAEHSGKFSRPGKGKLQQNQGIVV